MYSENENGKLLWCDFFASLLLKFILTRFVKAFQQNVVYQI